MRVQRKGHVNRRNRKRWSGNWRKHKGGARLEVLEPRQLLAGDLAAHWLAQDLVANVADGETVTDWSDNTSSIVAGGSGSPQLVHNGVGGRAVVRFDSGNGDDFFVIDRDDNPMSLANDFSVSVAFATSASGVGANGPWYEGTALVDANNLNFGNGWGVSINSTGQVGAGISQAFGATPSVYSTTSGLADSELHVATFTRSGGELSIYVDDQPVAVLSSDVTAPRDRDQFVIGRLSTGANAYTGDIAEVRVFDGALDATEVAQLHTEVAAFYNNGSPNPVDDRYVTNEDNPLFLVGRPGVLGNDTDPDDDALTAVLVDPPSNGDLSLNEDGSFVYAPVRDFHGIDQFTYRAFDFRESDTVATVTIEVTPTYDPAKAVNDSYSGRPDTPLNIVSLIGVLANDDNVDDADWFAQLETDSTQGTLNLNADGSFTYDPMGFAGTQTFTYVIGDGTGFSDPGTVTLVINTAPISVDDEFQIDEDSVLTRTAATGVLANDVEADGDALTVTLLEGTSNGTLDLQADGSFTYTPDLNYHGTDQFTYEISDGIEDSGVATVLINVNSVNDAPSASEDFYFALPDQLMSIPAQFGLLANDTDVESPDGLSVSLGAGVSNGVLDLAADGSFSYTPAPGFTGTDSFTYRASDGEDVTSDVNVTLTITPNPVTVSEVMATNADTLSTVLWNEEEQDWVGEELTPDWFEIRNFLGVPVDIGGFYVSDDPEEPTMWQFPRGTVVPASGYLVVFASGLDVTDPVLDESGILHTNFQIGSGGDYLSLASPSGDLLFETEIPEQRVHVTYGLDADNVFGYFEEPTPGAENGVALSGFVDDTQFSIDRGFYSEPIDVEVTSATEGAVIRYTVDGTDPTETNGIDYTGPIRIDATTTLRARAFKDGLIATNVDTHSYFFVSDIVRQDRNSTIDAGFPTSWRGTSADYGFDSADQLPFIAGDDNMSLEDAEAAIQESLLALPTLSIVMNVDDMFGTRGIYSNPQSSGEAWERATSVELIHPDGEEGFQIDAGIRIQGGAFRGFGLTRKKSFRFLFKSTYGEGKLEYPLFGPDAATAFDTLTARMESNDGWQWSGADWRPQYARDQFLRDVQRAMGQPSSNGRNFHLYINGFYWGMYNVVERPDQSFAESYIGSEKYDWDGQNSGSAINSDGDPYRSNRGGQAWRELNNLSRDIRTADTEEERTAAYMLLLGRNADGERNPELEVWLDDVNYIDYLIANYYGGNADWPFKNYYFGRENSPDSEGFKFFVWDAEWSLFLRSNVGTGLITDSRGVAAPFANLRQSEEFRLLWADRAHKHLFNGGVLYVDPENPEYDPEHPERNRPAAMYQAAVEQMYGGLIAESARWGDQHRSLPRTRDVDWQRQYDELMRSWFPNRSDDLLQLFKRLDLYPDTEVPLFNQRGGAIGTETAIELSAAQGTIYYTTDGTDPRQVGGTLSPSAIEYQGPFSLPATTVVKVRALNGEEWSAIDEAEFLVNSVPATSDNFRISEVHYHPGDATAAEIAAGFTDADDFEFVEFLNISDQIVDVSGVRLAQTTDGDNTIGLDFDFGSGAIQELQPGERLIVVESLEAFQLRYGESLPVAGQWSGGLNNASERIIVMAGQDILQSFEYSDEWHPSTDGEGKSLEHVNPNGELGLWGRAEGWAPSIASGGTPGTAPDDFGDVPGDSNRDGVFDSSDLVLVFAAGQYEDGIVGNSTFETGDWDGDGDFTTGDLVYAFSQGSYQSAAMPIQRRQGVAPLLPEPFARSDAEFSLMQVAAAHASDDEEFEYRRRSDTEPLKVDSLFAANDDDWRV